MTSTRMIATAVTSALLTATSVADTIIARDVLAKVDAAYKSIQTYKSEGTITASIDTGGMKMNIVTAFSVLLMKPNLYLVYWAQQNMPMPNMAQSGAVWSDGTQPYLFMGAMNAYSKMAGDDMALSAATGISGGAAFTVPALFLPVYREHTAPFSRLIDPRIDSVEMVGDEECYVLSSPSVISKKETYWISKTSYLIRRYERSLEPPEGGALMPEMTEDQLEEAIRGMGQEVTEESKNSMREMMERSKTMLKVTKLKGYSVEVHAIVSTPDLTQSDFTFRVPDGTVLKESLFGHMFGEKE